ncbi:hypothetical protein [aff. Roholtiella sp. LEGE 12411]|nr:hypothetical protein [aff. Roholtiella sp. LEGE 12411]MBE9038432.1 hypothetical protein [aff. Roholtiella sp. LEGE 12411]
MGKKLPMLYASAYLGFALSYGRLRQRLRSGQARHELLSKCSDIYI